MLSEEERKYYNIQENKVYCKSELPEKPEIYNWKCAYSNKDLFVVRMYKFNLKKGIIIEYELMTKDFLISFIENLQEIFHIIWTPEKEVIINNILIKKEIMEKVKEIELRIEENNKPAFYFIMDKAIKVDDLIY